MLGILLIISLTCYSQAIPCICDSYDPATDICNICQSGSLSIYNYCVYECPTGFGLGLASSCVQSDPTLKIINTKFSQFLTLSSNFVESFSTDAGSFSDAGNPKPTKDRGFYFESKSFLKSSTLLLIAPRLTVKLYFKPLTIGEILNVDQVFYLQLTSTGLKMSFSVQIPSSSCTVAMQEITENIQINQWNNVIFLLSQKSPTIVEGSIKVNGYSNSLTSLNTELIGLTIDNIFIGDRFMVNSASGFFYQLEVWNKIEETDLNGVNLSDCPFLTFQEGSQCVSCSASCGKINCVRKDDCNTCLSLNCTQCSGYGVDDCLACDNGLIPPWCCDFLCESCNGFADCLRCSAGFYLTFGVCVPEMPTGFISSEVLPYNVLSVSFKDRPWSQYFESFVSNDGFPVKVRNRGLYFNGNTNLMYSSNFVLSVQFSIRILLKSAAVRSPIISFPGYFSVYTVQNTISITLTDYTGSATASWIDQVFGFESWIYLTFSCTVSESDSVLIIYQDLNLLGFYYLMGSLRMNGVQFYLGSDKTSNYQGFLNGLEIFIGLFKPPDSQSVLLCTIGFYFGCVEDCDYLSYFENDLCFPCSNGCSENCVRGTDCNQCNNPNCKVCDSFLDVACIQCDTGFDLINGNCTCMAGYYDVNSVCFNCDPSCSACTGSGPMRCTLCSSSFQKVYNGSCINQCPNPFGYNLTHCIDYGYKAVDLRLNQMNSFSVYNYFEIGNDKINYDINDPLMQDSRGIYFKSSSYMKKSLALAYQFSLSFWAKVELAGYLCKKSTFSIEFLATEQIKIQIWLSGSEFLTYSPFAFGVWLNMNLQIEYLETMATKLTCYLFNSVQTTQTFPASLFFRDYSDMFFIGQADDSVNIFPGFQGFLWSFSISLGIDHVFDDLIACTCTLSQNKCPAEGYCFSPSSFHFASNDQATECDEKCITCSQPGICLYCYPDFIKNNGICECTGGLTWNQVSKICEVAGCEFSDCYPTCLTCDGCLTRYCTSCADGYYLLYGTCVRCPTGFNEDSNGCNFNYSLVVDLKFWNRIEKMNNLMVDDQVSNYYPEIRYLRGAYFDGDSFVKVKNLVLCPDFAVEIWFYPSVSEGCLFSYQKIESFESIYKIFIYESNLILNVIVSNMTHQSVIISQVDNSGWNLFTFWIKYVSEDNFLMNFKLNSITFNFADTEYIFDDGSSSIQSIIGAELAAGLTYNNFYKGFIYQLLVFNAPLSSMLETNCPEACPTCINDEDCLSTCHANSSLLNENCQNCEENESCLICGDFLCEECSDIFECEVCKNSSTLKNGKCKCDDGFFMNSSFECQNCEKGCKSCDGFNCTKCIEGFYLDGTCYPCSDFCQKCDENKCLECESGYYAEESKCFTVCDEKCQKCQEGKCKECKKNSFVKENKCQCLQGFEGTECTQKELHLNVSISFKNQIILYFSEEIKSELTGCISLEIKNSSFEFKINSWSKRTFKIPLKFQKTVEKDTLLTLRFECEIISVKNSKLLKNTYFSNLNYLEVVTVGVIFHETKSNYETLAISTVIFEIFFTIFNTNFAALWSFLSSLQLLTFLSLFNIKLSEKTKGLFIGLKKHMFFPNFLELLNISSGKTHQFTRAKELGFKTNSIFLNAGSIISLFTVGMLQFFLAKIAKYLLSLCFKTRFQMFFNKFLQKYHYGFFLRFWIQNFLEIGVACGITFFSVDLTDLEQAYGLFFACLLAFLMIVTIPILFLSSLMFKDKIKESSEKTMSLYGSLFYEFKDDEGGIRGNFYTFYFLRRLVMILSIFLMRSYPVIQLCLFGNFALANFFICITKRPFNESTLNILNSVTELIISIITIFLFLTLVNDSEKFIEGAEIVFMICVNSIVTIQVCGSVYIFAKNIRSIIQKRRREKIDNSNEKGFQIIVIEHKENIEQKNIEQEDLEQEDMDQEYIKQENYEIPNVSYLSINENYSISSENDDHSNSSVNDDNSMLSVHEDHANLSVNEDRPSLSVKEDNSMLSVHEDHPNLSVNGDRPILSVSEDNHMLSVKKDHPISSVNEHNPISLDDSSRSNLESQGNKD